MYHLADILSNIFREQELKGSPVVVLVAFLEASAGRWASFANECPKSTPEGQPTLRTGQKNSPEKRRPWTSTFHLSCKKNDKFKSNAVKFLDTSPRFRDEFGCSILDVVIVYILSH